jgi:molecular chaperone GrpE (heat shock protein)
LLEAHDLGGQDRGVVDSQISRIKRAEEAAKQLMNVADDLRREADRIEDHELREDLLESAEGFETEAQRLIDALREWREGIQ